MSSFQVPRRDPFANLGHLSDPPDALPERFKAGDRPLHFRTVTAALWDYTFVVVAVIPNVPIYAASIGFISTPFPRYCA